MRAAFFLLMAMGFHAMAFQADPTFYIETIRVVNSERVSDGIIIAESRLKAGREYSEPDLRRAVQRINQLNFVLEAEFSLERGSERGKYTLVINIKETTSFFYSLNLNHFEYDGPDSYSSSRNTGFLTLGYRRFVGKSGLLFAAFESSKSESTDGIGNAILGYSNYDLLGKNIFFSAELGIASIYGGFEDSIYQEKDQDFDLVPKIRLSLPLANNHWLKASSSYTQRDYTQRSLIVRDAQPPEFLATGRDRQTSTINVLSWEYNTTDDSTLPALGTLFSLSLEHAELKNKSQPNETYWGEETTQGSEAVTFAGEYMRYQRIRPRHSYSFGVAVRHSQNDAYLNGFPFQNNEGEVISDHSASSDSTQASASAGWIYDLWEGKKAQQWSDLRLEISGSYFYSRSESYIINTNPPPILADFQIVGETTSKQISAGLFFRNHLGTIRIEASYAFDHDTRLKQEDRP